MGNASTAFGIDVAQHVAQTTNITLPAQWYIGLATDSAGLANGDATNELYSSETAGYARQAITFVEGSGGVPENNATISITASGADWAAVQYWFIAESATEGTNDVKMWGNLSETRTIRDGDTIRWAAGAFTLTGT